jgi:hypothetical protein
MQEATNSGCTTAFTFRGNVMPIKNVSISANTLAAHQQLSFETLVGAWLLGDGWEVFYPAIDHGAKTDLVVGYNKLFYRIQVKSIESAEEDIKVENKWKGVDIDYVVYFSRQGDWGYVAPAFKQNRKRINAPEHRRFQKTNQMEFLAAFERA